MAKAGSIWNARRENPMRKLNQDEAVKPTITIHAGNPEQFLSWLWLLDKRFSMSEPAWYHGIGESMNEMERRKR